jgi:hypothetical protein
MLMALGLVLLGVVVFQFFIQQVSIRIFGPWRVDIHRDEWPAFYWCVMLLQVCGGGFFIWLSLSGKD